MSNREYLHKGPHVVLSFLLLLLLLLFCVLCGVQARKEGWGATGTLAPPPPQAPEVHFFINQRLKTK